MKWYRTRGQVKWGGTILALFAFLVLFIVMWSNMYCRYIYSYFGATSVFLYALDGVSVQYIWVECGTSVFYRGNIKFKEKLQNSAAQSIYD